MMICAQVNFRPGVGGLVSEVTDKLDDRDELLTSSTASTLFCGQHGNCLPNSSLAPILDFWTQFLTNGEV